MLGPHGRKELMANRNRVREGLARGEFVLTFEMVAPELDQPFEASIAPALRLAEWVGADPRIHGLSVTDRVRSDRDHDPVAIGARLMAASGIQPIVHLSGKACSPEAHRCRLEAMRAAGLAATLIITGDKVKRPEVDGPVRYLDSVIAIREARAAWGELWVAAAVSPFKYREEELLNQYLKMVKKWRAGADWFIAQVGWDMEKYQELLWYRAARGLPFPLVANVFLLIPGAARYIHQGKVPGVLVTDDLLAKVEEEARGEDKGRGAAYRRLALQIVGLKRMGYAGAQVSGVHTLEGARRLLDLVGALDGDLPSLEAWRDAWLLALTLSDGRVARTAPADGLYLALGAEARAAWPLAGPPDPGLARASEAELRRYRQLDAVDRLVFKEGTLGYHLVGPLVRAADRMPGLRTRLLAVEKLAKHALVGCQTCGFCRLPDTFYVCPETCPKGLANGPCGGTDGNRCEYGDRECIHNVKYRVAKAAGALADLEEVYIPPVPDRRDTCSWTHHFRAEDPRVVRLPAPVPAEGGA
jgi:methylenetetrahydrofolate reductase (NADPH)